MQVGLYPVLRPYKKGKQRRTDTQRRPPTVMGADWCDAATDRGTPGSTALNQSQERRLEMPLPSPQEATNPADTLVLLL